MKKQKNSKPSLRVGVIGYGGAYNMGRQHLVQMREAGMIPHAVAEVDPNRLSVAGEDFPGIGLFPTVKAMLAESEVDLVTIITPHNTHAALALECLRAGKHVVCEKPLAITTAEVDAMIKAAKKAGTMLSTYHNRHWDGRILLALDLIKRKKILGDIIRIECRMGGYACPGDWWRSSRSISGGILYDWGVHLIEYSLQLLDGGATEVSGFAHEGFWAPQTAWKADTIEDEGQLIARFDSGQWLTVRITQIESNPKPGWVEITGTKGTLVLDSSHSTLYQHANGREVVTRIPNLPDEGWRYYRNIAAHLDGKEDLAITPEWSRRPIHLLDLAAKSARSGKTLRTKYA